MESGMPGEVARFQAKWQLGFLRPEEVPEAASSMLLAGVQGETLAVLAGLINPSRAEIEPLVRRFLTEVAVEPITDGEARWLLVRAGLEAITAGTLAPRTGAAQLAFICGELGMPEVLRHFVYLSADYDPDDAWFDEQIRSSAADALAQLRPSPGVAT